MRKALLFSAQRLAFLYGLSGLVLGAALANAATIYTNGFEGAEAAAVAAPPAGLGIAGQYVYGNQGGWTQTGSAPGNDWWYSTAYATVNRPISPDPFGTTAFHMRSQYAYRVLGNTFASGSIYTLSVMAATDAGDATGTRNVALYLWDGDGAVPANWDTGSSAGGNFYPAGSSAPYTAGVYLANVTLTATPNYQTAAGNNAGNWQMVEMQFVAPAALNGRHIGIAMFGRNNVALDNLQLGAVIPEPATTASLGLAGAMIFLRRRRVE